MRLNTSADGMALAVMAPIVYWSPASQGHASAMLMEGKGPGLLLVSFGTGASVRRMQEEMVQKT